MDSITSTRSPRVARARALKTRAGRQESGLFLAEGPDVVQGLWHAGWVEEIWATEDGQRHLPRGASSTLVSPPVLKAISDTATPQGIVAMCRVPPWTIDSVAARAGQIIVGERLNDPGNVGTIVRTLAAVGGGGLVLTTDSVDPLHAKVVRSSAGVLSLVPVVGPVGLASARASLSSRTWVATAPDADIDLFDAIATRVIPPDPVWVIGSEAHGLSADAAQVCKVRVRIPMAHGVESVNAAVAAAVCLYGVVARDGVGSQPG